MAEKSLYKPSEVMDLIQTNSAVLIDIRDPQDYKDEHILDALNMPEVFYTLSESSPSGLSALQNQFQELFSQAGVTRDKTVIFYEESLDSRYGGSCRGYWLLTYLGHPRAGILYGGLTIWLEEGYPTNNKSVQARSAPFQPTVQHHLMATKEDVLRAIHDPSIKLLDNRDRPEWLGKVSSPYDPDFAPRKGRIPGARWIEWYEFMERPIDFPAFKKKKDILQLCASRGIAPSDDIIIYCFKGARASNTYIALKESGFERVRVYFASWNEWSRDFSLPIDERLLEDVDQETGLP